MAEREQELIQISYGEIQPVVGYKDWNRIPTVISKQTSTLLDIVHRRNIGNTGPAIDYLQKYTLPYLFQALKGSADIFGQLHLLDTEQDVEGREAADHAYITMGSMPDMVSHKDLPRGFSRKGMLKPPETHGEFIRRILEIQSGVISVISDNSDETIIYDGSPQLFRTFEFFRVGSNIPVELEDSDKVKLQLEKDNFNFLLDGIKFD